MYVAGGSGEGTKGVVGRVLGGGAAGGRAGARGGAVWCRCVERGTGAVWGGMPRAWQKNTGTRGGGVSSGRASCIDTRERPGGSGGPTRAAPV